MRSLHVITHRQWLARELAAGYPGVRHGFGLDVPAGLLTGDALWAPMEWAVRARRTARDVGAVLPLADPGPAWLTTLPSEALGRDICCTTLGDLASRSEEFPATGFYKPANAKIEAVPAQWIDRDDFLAAATAAGVPAGTEVLVCWTRLRFAEEHRIFVLHGEAVISSPYLIDGVTYTDDMTSRHDAAAARFAADIAATVPGPAAYVVDVGRVAEGPRNMVGEWVVIEANPVWCSNPYGADPATAAAVILAANQASSWDWDPDPWLVRRAARQRLLTVA